MTVLKIIQEELKERGILTYNTINRDYLYYYLIPENTCPVIYTLIFRHDCVTIAADHHRANGVLASGTDIPLSEPDLINEIIRVLKDT